MINKTDSFDSMTTVPVRDRAIIDVFTFCPGGGAR